MKARVTLPAGASGEWRLAVLECKAWVEAVEAEAAWVGRLSVAALMCLSVLSVPSLTYSPVRVKPST